MKNFPSSLKLLAAVALILSGVAVSHGGPVSEPGTVFYGRIINRTNGQTYVLTAGTLAWRLRPASGPVVTLNTTLQPLRNGDYSYRLNVPHQALVSGLSVASGTIPLGGQAVTWTHDQISVNGVAVAILPPGATSFTVSQSARGATYRLDLEINGPIDDQDGNGIPDWWQNRYSANDPTADPDGDGRNNLAEFRNGSDPNHDDRAPTLSTRELRAYADGTTAVLLRSIDVDSEPANLTYMLAAAPASGILRLRNTTPGGTIHDSNLAAGATFSQADVNASRLVLIHNEESLAPTTFQVILRDETAAHLSSTGTVAVTFYKPAIAPSMADVNSALAATPKRFPNVAGVSASEEPMAAAHALSQGLNFVVCDASDGAANQILSVPSSGLSASNYAAQYVPSFGVDRPHIFLGGAGDDTISGSMESDILIGGQGADRLRGNGGADLFVFSSAADGDDVIEDFNPDEGDVIDLSRLLTGTSPWLTNYVQLAPAGTNTQLLINCAGTGGAYHDLTLTLAGVQLSQSAFVALVESGKINAGGKVSAPRVHIVASRANASENGPVSGEFTLTRSGPLDRTLTVDLQLTGTAVNGSDFAYINPQATFLPGSSSLSIQINPFVDAVSELSEVVDLAVLAGPGYESDGSATARVTIEDLAPQISIEALEPLAVKSDGAPGVFLITRAGVLDRSVLVRLNVGGTASAGDFSGVPTFVNFVSGQTTALITVTPRSTAVLSNGVEFVQVSIRPDSSYRLNEPTSARVILINEQISFVQWRDRYFPGATADIMAFANQDPGQFNIRNILRYAYGLDPHSPQTSSGLPQSQIRDDHLTLNFRRPASVTDLEFVVEVSDDLVTWRSGNAYVEPFIAPEFANQVEMASYRVKRSVKESSAMFMRVRIVYTP